MPRHEAASGAIRNLKVSGAAVATSQTVAATICTVTTDAHNMLLRLNHELTRILNAGDTIAWKVVDNHQIHENEQKRRILAKRREAVGGTEENLAFGAIRDLLGVHAIDGPAVADVFNSYKAAIAGSSKDIDAAIARFDNYAGSYHHAAALGLACGLVDTRFMVVMDPDFFVVYPDWIAAVIRFMTAQGVAVFGAPWSPKYYQKYRYFPCSHFLVIDREAIRWRSDLLNPDLTRAPRYISPFWSDHVKRRHGAKSEKESWSVATVLRSAVEDARQRMTIGASRDTGYGLKKHVESHPNLRSYCISPSYRREHGFLPRSVSDPQVSGLMARMLPDRFSYLPRRKGFATELAFRDLGYPDFQKEGWEEFLWDGRAFAFHVRGEIQRKRAARLDHAALLSRLNGILMKAGRAAIDQNILNGSNVPE